MDSFYKTTINILKKPILTEISQTPFLTNIPLLTTDNRNSKKSSYSKYTNLSENRKKNINIFFPYHIFSKFSLSFESNINNKNNILPKIKSFKDLIKTNEELLQKNIDTEKEEFLQKLNYQKSEFFLQFLKKTTGLLKNPNNDKNIFNKKYSNINVKRKNKYNQKLKKITFWEPNIILINNKKMNKNKVKSNSQNNFIHSNSNTNTIDNSENKKLKKSSFENIFKKNYKIKLNIGEIKSSNKNFNILPTAINLKSTEKKYKI